MALATKPKKNTTSHKKRGGKHHRHTDSYLKHYWPYIPMLLIVGFGLVFNTIWSHGSVLGTSNDFSGTTFLNATNTQRAKHHRPPLILNDQLNVAAQAKADDMAKRNYWSHDTPDGQAPGSFVMATGYNYQATGENLAYGFGGAGETVTGWMNSSAHRDNILNANYRDVGFGVAQSLNYQGQGPTTIVVAEYGLPAGVTLGTAQAASSPTVGSSQSVSRLQLLTGQSSWLTALIAAIAGGAITLFFIRHSLYLKRLVIRGEHFVLQRPLLDIALVFVATMGLIAMQAGGVIH